MSMFTGCYTTTDAVYNVTETETKYLFDTATIISHQNNMGVLYYTYEPIYIHPDTRQELLLPTLEAEQQVRYKVITNYDFPFSTYSDAVTYKNEHTFPPELVLKHYDKELVKPEEKVFSPIKTGLAIGIPVTVLLTGLLGITSVQNKIEKG
jgi:hypothetical protein